MSEATATPETIDYPKEYDNSGRVENAADLIDGYSIDSALYRANEDLIADYDLAYGTGKRNLMDIFWPSEDRNAPIIMFIHGGYWQRMDRTSFSHLAQGLTENGFAVAMPSYTLCPDTDIEGIITEMRRACILLYQTYEKRICVVGHSAGGHLAACMMATDWAEIHPELPEDLVMSGLGISGLYDLEPIIHTPINEALGMDLEQAHRASPMRWLPDTLRRFEAWVGGDESDEYHRQSRELSTHWTMLGTPTQYVSAENQNHFTIINQLTDPESEMVKRIMALARQPKRRFKLANPDENAVQAELQDIAIPEELRAKPKKKKTKKSKSSKAKPTKDDKDKQQDKTPQSDKAKDEET